MGDSTKSGEKKSPPAAQSIQFSNDSAIDSAHLAPVTGDKVPDPAGSGPRVVFFGTSLTFGYGIQPTQAFPVVVQRLAEKQGLPIRAFNAGLSGETSAGAVRRIDWDVRTPFDMIVLETGANDALRALDPADLKANLIKIIRKVKHAQPRAKIVLLQMEAPPNLGSSYGEQFRQAYVDAAKEERVKLLPFFMEGVAGRPELNQEDGVHPTSAGAKLIAENVWRGLKPLVADLTKRGNYAPKN